jgi:aspartate/methionine/tyrosine aminotransferase
VHTGGSEALWHLFIALVRRGDHVVVPRPTYPLLYEVPRALGCDVSFWDLREERGWQPDLDELRGLLRRKTRLLVLNFPSNPCGSSIARGVLEETLALAEESGAVVIGDEVYRGLELAPGDRLPAVCDLSERSVSVGSLSKAYGVPGLRIGWLASRLPGLAAALGKTKSYVTICNNALGEIVAERVLAQGDALLTGNVARLRTHAALLDAMIARSRGTLQWTKPTAGAMGFVRLARPLEASTFCQDLLERTGVLLVPSETLGFGTSHARIGFGRRDFADGLRLLEAHLLGATGD